LLTITIR